jgi:hypothetical protein
MFLTRPDSEHDLTESGRVAAGFTRSGRNSGINHHPTKMKYLALGLQACFSATIFSPAPELCFGNLYQSILFVSLERGMKNTS